MDWIVNETAGGKFGVFFQDEADCSDSFIRISDARSLALALNDAGASDQEYCFVRSSWMAEKQGD